MPISKSTVSVLLSYALLVACGGGSSATGSTNPTTPPAPTGTCVAGARSSNSGVQLTNAFPNLSFDLPVAMIPTPSGNTVYVVELAGVVKAVVNSPTTTTTTTFIDITAKVSMDGEGGLLGMAFDPNYASNGYVYLSYTAPSRDGFYLISTIARYSANATKTALIPSSEVVLLEIGQPANNHNGGQIAFGNDNYLYFASGDGGGSDDGFQSGQNTSVLLGKFLRIDVSGTDTIRNKPYRIPAGNPFANNTNCTGGCPEIFAWGMRNPWRFSFDRTTGTLWAGDVGQGAREEIDIIEAGNNYGWGCYEGTVRNTSYSGSCPTNLVHTPPVIEYPREEGTTVTGGYVYRGSAMPGLTGQYIFTDYGYLGTIWAVSNPYETSRQRRILIASTGIGHASMAEDANGELYTINIGTGVISKIIPDTNSPSVPAFAAQLSATGCANTNDPKQAAGGMIAYDLNAQLWSDGASKQRWLALPPNGHVQVGSTHDWSFPIGSVLRKDFYLGNRIIETRLLAHHTDGTWAGYSYEWNATETNATLLNNSKTVTIDAQQWTYPSPTQCLGCHTSAAGITLGPETAQLNRNITHPGNGSMVNQISYLQSLNVFAAALPATATWPQLADYNNISLDPTARARAYLHANCSHCHRENNITQTPMDLRYDRTLFQMSVCDVPNSRGMVNNSTLLIAHGDANSSILYHRMNNPDSTRMPPLGSNVVDTFGTALIAGWINSLTGCPTQ